VADNDRRRSTAVTLTVLGLVATVVVVDKAIPRGTELRRNVYASRADCERDYAADQCAPQNSGGSGGYYTGGYYHGPYYSANRSQAAANDPGPGRSGAVHVAAETSARGGFGAVGRAGGGGRAA